MKLYVACLASYNNGVTFGKWVDASSDVDEMNQQIAQMLRSSPFPNVMVKHPETGEEVPSAEEWAVHDYDELPDFGKYPNLDEITDFVSLVEDDDNNLSVGDIGAVVKEFGGIAEARKQLENCFSGKFNYFDDYAIEFADDVILSGCENETVRRYFDYERFIRDLEMYSCIVDVPDGVLVFSY